MYLHTFDFPERFVVGAVGEPGSRAFFLQASTDGRTVNVGLEKSEAAALADGMTRLLAEVRRSSEVVPDRARVQAALDRAPLQAPVEEHFRLSGLTVSWDGEQVVVEAAGAPADVLEEALRERLAAVLDADDDTDGFPDPADGEAPEAPRGAAAPDGGPPAPAGERAGGFLAAGAGGSADLEAWEDLASVEREAAGTAPELGADLVAEVEAAFVDVADLIGEADLAAGDGAADDTPVIPPLPVSDVLRVALSVEQAYAFVTRATSVVAAGRRPCLLCGRPSGLDGHFCPRLN